jgi:hypothetical protein
LYENIIKIIYKVLKYKLLNAILIIFWDRVFTGWRMKYRLHPQTSFRGTFSSIPISTEKKISTNFESSNGTISPWISIYG